MAIEAEGDRELTREEIVELADAVAGHSGIASGIGTFRYGAQLVVDADSLDDAVEQATRAFSSAVARAGLPPWPVVRMDALSEADDDESFFDALASKARA